MNRLTEEEVKQIVRYDNELDSYDIQEFMNNVNELYEYNLHNLKDCNCTEKDLYKAIYDIYDIGLEYFNFDCINGNEPYFYFNKDNNIYLQQATDCHHPLNLINIKTKECIAPTNKEQEDIRRCSRIIDNSFYGCTNTIYDGIKQSINELKAEIPNFNPTLLDCFFGDFNTFDNYDDLLCIAYDDKIFKQVIFKVADDGEIYYIKGSEHYNIEDYNGKYKNQIEECLLDEFVSNYDFQKKYLDNFFIDKETAKDFNEVKHELINEHIKSNSESKQSKSKQRNSYCR